MSLDIENFISTAKEKLGENYDSISSAMDSLKNDVISLQDYNGKLKYEAKKKRDEISDLKVKLEESGDAQTKLEELNTKISELETAKKQSEEKLTKFYDGRRSEFMSLYEKHKIKDSKHKGKFLLPEKLEDMTNEEVEANLAKVKEYEDLGVFKVASADNNKPNPQEEQQVKDFASIYTTMK